MGNECFSHFAAVAVVGLPQRQLGKVTRSKTCIGEEEIKAAQHQVIPLIKILYIVLPMKIMAGYQILF